MAAQLKTCDQCKLSITCTDALCAHIQVKRLNAQVEALQKSLESTRIRAQRDREGAHAAVAKELDAQVRVLASVQAYVC